VKTWRRLCTTDEISRGENANAQAVGVGVGVPVTGANAGQGVGAGGAQVTTDQRCADAPEAPAGFA